MESDYDDVALEKLKKRMIKRQIAWCYSLGQELRGHSAIKGMEKYLSVKDMDALAGYSNIPAAMLHQHGRDIQEALRCGYINRFQQVELDRTLSRLCDAQGKCERIKNTVFPSTYSLYIHFSLLLFICLLPFGFIGIFGIMEVLVVTAISSCFLLIEKMARHLPDPFDNKPTDTPVTSIAKKIERDLRQMMNDGNNRSDSPVAIGTVVNQNYYIM
jgi:putative membrane protein